MSDVQGVTYFCPGSCGDVSVERARDTGRQYYGPTTGDDDDDQRSTASQTEQPQDTDTGEPQVPPEPGLFYSISEKCIDSENDEEDVDEEEESDEYEEIDEAEMDTQPNSSDVRTETGCRIFGTGSCVEVVGKIPDEWELAAQQALLEEEDSEFPSVKYYTTPSCETVRPERQRSTGLRHFGGIDYRSVRYFCPAKKCDFMPAEPERDTGLTTFTGGAYDDQVYRVKSVPEFGNIDEIRVISGCHYFGSGLCIPDEPPKPLRPGEGPEFVRYFCPGSCLDLEPEKPRDTGAKYFGKPTGVTSDDSLAVSVHEDEVDSFPLVRYFCTPSCENVLAEWPRETGKKFFTGTSTASQAAEYIFPGRPVRYFCVVPTDKVPVERPRETGMREFGPPDETLFGYDYNLSDARTQSGCVYYSGEPCIDVVTADKSIKPPQPEKYFCPGPCWFMPAETPRDTGRMYFGPAASSTPSLSDVDGSVTDEPDTTEQYAFNLMDVRVKTSRWYFSGVPMYDGFAPVRYFCPGSCESLAAEPVRRTGSDYFGSEAVARLGPVSSRIGFGNSSDVRVQTGCEYFGPGPCLDVVGWDRVPRCLTWSCTQVAGWIEQLGFTKYRDCFIDNYVTGRRLIHVNASTLPKLGITNVDHIKVEEIPWNRSIRLPPREQLALFLERKSISGHEADKLSIDKFADDWEYLRFEPPLCNHAMLLPRDDPASAAP